MVLQYSGPGLFARLRPFFLGMILGESLWLAIDALNCNCNNRIIAM